MYVQHMYFINTSIYTQCVHCMNVSIYIQYICCVNVILSSECIYCIVSAPFADLSCHFTFPKQGFVKGKTPAHTEVSRKPNLNYRDSF